jgi:hypothetical protein
MCATANASTFREPALLFQYWLGLSLPDIDTKAQSITPAGVI